jgi:uncharacterized spore protein YtfJ
MSLESMFESIESLRGTASADAVLGEPQQVEGKVLISVASVTEGFGIGFGQDTALESGDDPSPPAEDRHSGAGGRARSHPVALVEVTRDATIIKPVIDETKVALASLALIGWIVFWITATVRSVFAGHHQQKGT